MGGFFGCPNTSSGGSGGTSFATLGARLPFTSPAGAAVAAAPAGFSSSQASPTGRLLVTLTADTTWVSLTAGYDGQMLELVVVAGNFTLTLPQADFGGVGDHVLGLNNAILLYYDTTDGAWQVTSP